ncbi:MAG: alpha/beta hydrolase, partial [Chlamydiia bacterium]|nr:alpha/beta hydrolase [Chlamydiia bacterium]
MPIDEWKGWVSSGSIEIDGCRLSYSIEGSGPTALVIGSSKYYSKSFSPGLRKHFRLVFLDWRGFAPDPDPCESEIALDTLLDDIEICRKRLALGSVIVIGHSAHALMALEYAKKYPEHVSRVVMIGISPNLSSRYAESADRNWRESVWSERKKALDDRIKQLPDSALAELPPDQRFVKWYIRRAPQAWYDYRFDSSFLWQDVTPNMKMFDFLYGVALRDLDISLGLENFHCPVFLALGRYDYIVAPASSWD